MPGSLIPEFIVVTVTRGPHFAVTLKLLVLGTSFLNTCPVAKANFTFFVTLICAILGDSQALFFSSSPNLSASVSIPPPFNRPSVPPPRWSHLRNSVLPPSRPPRFPPSRVGSRGATNPRRVNTTSESARSSASTTSSPRVPIGSHFGNRRF
jgi:hypothetical protein